MAPGRSCPWNPFDTAEDRLAFPDVTAALRPGCGGVPLLCVDALARLAPAAIECAQPRAPGLLPPDLAASLEAGCQIFFDELAAHKACRVRQRCRQAVAG